MKSKDLTVEIPLPKKAPPKKRPQREQAREPSLPSFSSSGTVASSDYGTNPRPQTDTVAAHTRRAIARRRNSSGLTARNLSYMRNMIDDIGGPHQSVRSGESPASDRDGLPGALSSSLTPAQLPEQSGHSGDPPPSDGLPGALSSSLTPVPGLLSSSLVSVPGALSSSSLTPVQLPQQSPPSNLPGSIAAGTSQWDIVLQMPSLSTILPDASAYSGIGASGTTNFLNGTSALRRPPTRLISRHVHFPPTPMVTVGPSIVSGLPHSSSILTRNTFPPTGIGRLPSSQSNVNIFDEEEKLLEEEKEFDPPSSSSRNNATRNSPLSGDGVRRRSVSLSHAYDPRSSSSTDLHLPPSPSLRPSPEVSFGANIDDNVDDT